MNDSPWCTVGTDTDVADEFDIGDVVSLIVGGPDMVVISVCE